MSIQYFIYRVDLAHYFNVRQINNLCSYRRLGVKEVDEVILANSRGREEVFSKLPQPKSKADVLNMLGDQTNKKGYVFRDYEDNSNKCVTICVGKSLFNCIQIKVKRTNKNSTALSPK